MRTFGTACPGNRGKHSIIGVLAKHRRALAIADGHDVWRVSLSRQLIPLCIRVVLRWFTVLGLLKKHLG
jgi:hypothetical protein